MKTRGLGVFSRFFTDSRKSVVHILEDPQLWSEDIARQTLERLKGSPYDIRDVEQVLREYCVVLREHLLSEETM